MSFSISNFSRIYANENLYQPIVMLQDEEYTIIEDSINRLEDVNVKIKSVYQLYDVNSLPNFLLVVFADGGYAIVTNDNFDISEYSLESNSYIPYLNSNMEGESWIYGGPLNYIIKTNDNKFYDLQSNLEINFNVREDLVNLSNSIVNENVIKEVEVGNDFSLYASGPTSWTGIDSSRFSRYAWENNDGICGAYASAIMLAYYQDYLPSIVSFDNSVRTRNSTSPGSLITKVASSISNPKSTIPQDVGVGVAKMLNTYNTAGSYVTCYYSSGGTWSTATSKIASLRPVCIGLSGLMADNKYGWHWVTAYAYGTDSSGNGYYRCNTNWGSEETAMTIRTSWTIGMAYLNK